MFKLKKYFILYIMFILLFSFICTLYYFNILNSLLFKVFKFISIMLLFMIQGSFTFKDLSKFKFIISLLPSIILVLFFLLISFLFNKFNIKLLLYFSIIFFSSLFGIFIQKKKAYKN